MSKEERKTEFDKLLADLVGRIKYLAERKFEYNEATNLPKAILRAREIVPNALSSGVVHAWNEAHKWEPNAAAALAADLLEDVNLHADAAHVRVESDTLACLENLVARRIVRDDNDHYDEVVELIERLKRGAA